MGVSIYVLLIVIAFLGYVLPWGQISYWGATVITNLLRVVPYVGTDLVKLIWGGDVIGDRTLKRFYLAHVLLPFILLGLFGVHMYYLHEIGSNNPLGVEDARDLIRFHPYYSLKDFVGIVGLVGSMFLVIFLAPNIFGGGDNFIPADPFKTPLHIQPEWYFLFAYTVLRRAKRKGGGVIVIGISIGVLYILPFNPRPIHLGLRFYPISQFYFWCMVSSFLGLTYLGRAPVGSPHYELGRFFTFVYFSYFLSFSWPEYL
jgi:ubiquinol-cytochrome c reductase cytochrome b subunit